MGLLILREDKDIIQVDHQVDVNESCEGSVNVRLEGGRSINKPKRHYRVFEVSVAAPKRRLLLVSLLDADPMIGISQI